MNLRVWARARTAAVAVVSLVVCLAVFATAAAAVPPADGEDTLTAFNSIRLTNVLEFQRSLHRRATASRFEVRSVGAIAPLVGQAEADFRITPGRKGPGQGTWLEGSGRYSDLEGDANANGIISRAFSARGGYDVRFGRSPDSGWSGLRVGSSFAYYRSHFDAQSSVSDGDANSFMIGLHAAYALPRFYISVAGSYTYDLIEIRRRTQTPPDALGKTLGSQLGGGIEIGGLLFNPRSLAVQPIAGFDYNRIQQNGFSENAGGAAGGGPVYEVAQSQVNSFVTRLGLRLSRLFVVDPKLFGNGSAGEFGIEPELRFFWDREWGDIARPVLLTPIGGGPLQRFEGARSNRDAFVVGVGYTMRIHDIALVRADYDAHIEARRIDQVVQLSLLFTF